MDCDKRAALMRAVVAAMERDYGQEEFGQSFWKTLDNSIRGSDDMRTGQELAEYFDRIFHNDKIKFTRAPMSSEKPREDPDELDLVVDTESVEFVYSHNVPPPADIMDVVIESRWHTRHWGYPVIGNCYVTTALSHMIFSVGKRLTQPSV
ncbi:hypothetical protein BC832DRAFT_622921 [Gaertneriomyces semiglobifer]|nr:hypothetical protein BC832DRAFT_622921 [Gaertneriomyces semiglobifer]